MFFSFHHFGSVERAQTRQAISAPHSLWVSPSEAPARVRVHLVAVLRPPHTCSTSSPLRSRAPLRTNTLFWSFMLFSFCHWVGCVVPGVSRELFGGAGKAPPCSATTALTDGGISILVGTNLGWYSANVIGMQPSTHALDFLHTQLTSAPANQNPILIVHGLFSFHILGL